MEKLLVAAFSLLEVLGSSGVNFSFFVDPIVSTIKCVLSTSAFHSLSTRTNVNI